MEFPSRASVMLYHRLLRDDTSPIRSCHLISVAVIRVFALGLWVLAGFGVSASSAEIPESPPKETVPMAKRKPVHVNKEQAIQIAEEKLRAKWSPEKYGKLGDIESFVRRENKAWKVTVRVLPKSDGAIYDITVSGAGEVLEFRERRPAQLIADCMDNDRVDRAFYLEIRPHAARPRSLTMQGSIRKSWPFRSPSERCVRGGRQRNTGSQTTLNRVLVARSAGGW